MSGRGNRKLELLAPAGSYPALAAAVRNGADAVYFGIGRLNMRARAASPFDEKDLRRIARICRRCGVRAYLALNTIVYDEELDALRAACDAAREAELDAVIATDPAAIEYARSIGLPVHISVQANISNLDAIRFYARYADVVVLARELRLEQIARIAKAVREEPILGPSGRPVRIEAFAHGALCVAISGVCHMSLALYDQSANRGSCFQPCRRRYRVTDAETGAELEIDNQYVMSPRDLCTLPFLDRLAEAGVEIFKIEGRARSADYVATVVRAYREALDAVEAGAFDRDRFIEREKELETVFNRGFWRGGYYLGKKLGEWAAGGNSQATRKRVQLGVVSNYFARIGVAEFTLWQKELRLGAELLIEGPTTGAVRITPDELRIDGRPARKAVKGDRVTFPVPARVRRNDKIFLLLPVERTEKGKREAAENTKARKDFSS